MAAVSSLTLSRFKQLPQRSQEVWQGGVVRMPVLVDNPDDPDRPIRPKGVMWGSLRSGRVHLAVVETEADAPAAALEALFEFAKREVRLGGGRPARVEVRDEALKQALTDALAGTGTFVDLVAALPVVQDALRDFEDSQAEGGRIPGLLEGKGVTVERAHAFADAAQAFFRARPWRHLGNDDLLVVESPVAPKGLGLACVMGAGGQEFGLAFFPTRRAFERMMDGDPRNVRAAFGLTFDGPEDLPFADADAWEDHGFPVAGPTAYPLLAEFRSDRTVRRPDARALAFVEGLLRALAQTTEDEFDSGRWQHTVDTAEGSVSYTLALPDLLEPVQVEPSLPFQGTLVAERLHARVARFMNERSFESLDEANDVLEGARARGLFSLDEPADLGLDRRLTALEEAQELAYAADEATGRRRIVLAKKALDLSQDCADAWSVLGDVAATPEEALERYLRAVEAGQSALGDDGFARAAGHFWSDLRTRPYMRARAALADVLVTLGRTDEAVEHLRALLELNPNDNQGMRHVLLPLLLRCHRDADAHELLARYAEDSSSEFAYGRALLEFRKSADSATARAALRAALETNRHVAAFLLDPETAPWLRDAYVTLGGADEAVGVAGALLPAFEETPGALDWLKKESTARQVRPRRGGSRTPRGTWQRRSRR